MEKSACFLCGNPTGHIQCIGQDPFPTLVDCAVCGKYMIDQAPAANLTHIERYALAWIVRDLRAAAETEDAHPAAKYVSINGADVSRYVRQALAREPTPSGKGRLILEAVKSRSHAFGSTVPWDRNAEWPKVKCRGADECGRIIAELVKQRLLGHNREYTQLNLTWEGWKQLAPLTGSASGRVFIAIWFDAEMDSAYLAIKGEIEEAGLIPIRVDEQTSDDKICEQILNEIHRAEFVVADFTGQRSGVYFEAGYAKALNKKVIWLCRKDQEQQLHLDTRQYPYILWTDPTDLANQLKQKLRYLLQQARDSERSDHNVRPSSNQSSGVA